MSAPTWVRDAVFYQIFPDRFARSTRLPDTGYEPWDSPPSVHGFKGGNLFGIIERLDYLTDLGITALYLNPIFSSAANHRYHTYDYFEVDPLLGGDKALRELLDAAHSRNMRIILDGVFNHASRGFWQFHHVLETGAASPYKEWFHFDTEHLHGRKQWGAYPTGQQLIAIQQEGSVKAIGYQGWWNLPALPKFNTHIPEVREFLFSVAEHWIRFGADGWRLDVPGEIDDDTFWREFRQRVKNINSEAYIVGEIWYEAQRWLQGDQFDAVMNYPNTAAAMGFFAGSHLDLDVVNSAGGIQGRVHAMNAEGFANEIDRIFHLYPLDLAFAQLNLLSSHDMPRFITCCGNDANSLKLALLFIFSFPGAPCIYYGDEIGLTGRQDPDCRKSFPWEERHWNKSIFDYAKELIHLRKIHPALRNGSFERYFAHEGIYAFTRQEKNITLLICINTQDTSETMETRYPFKPNRGKPLFGDAKIFESPGNQLSIELQPRSGVMIQIHPS
jgi:neopullulanase